MKKSFIDRLVYSMTKKPKHCVEVRNPPKTAKEKLLRLQEARQIQYNNWSKYFKIYSGSYLPKDHNDLLKKGWKKKKVSIPNKHHFYQRKSTNQTIRYDEATIDKHGIFRQAHYHWYIWWRNFFGPKTERRFRRNQRKNHGTAKVYYNEYGEKTSFNKLDHHIYR